MNFRDNPDIADIIEWDVLNWSNALSHWRPALVHHNPETSRVLCIGERHGGISLWFASLGYKVVCSDYGGPSEKARALHLRYGVSHRVVYADMNVFHIPEPNASFDIVACKSVIGGFVRDETEKNRPSLSGQKAAISEIYRILKPGGTFFGAENMKGCWLHSTLRQKIKSKRSKWRYLGIDEIHPLFANFESLDIKYFGFFGSLYRLNWVNRILNGLDIVLSSMLADSFLYIVFVIARKGLVDAKERRSSADHLEN